jgi:ankyrin repeat protein
MKKSAELIAATRTGNASGVRALLAEDSALASTRDENGVSAIMLAAYHRQAEILALLLASKPELDIFEATIAGQKDRVDDLLKRDPSLASSFSVDGFTPLHLAAFFSQAPTADALLAHGADPAAVSRNAMNVMPLHSACAAQNLAVARTLLEHKAHVNARQEKGWTPIHSVAQSGNLAMVELLLSHGADPSLANDDGTTAIQLAAKGGHSSIVQLLEKQKSA